MKSNFNIRYIIIIIVTVFGLAFFYVLMNHAKARINNQVKAYAESIENYAAKICETEIDRNRSVSNFLVNKDIFNDTYENIRSISDDKYYQLIDEFNILSEHPKNSYLIFKDGTYYCSANAPDEYFRTHNILIQDFYLQTQKNFAYTIIPYNNYDDEDAYMMIMPIFDSQKEFVGEIIRTGDFNWLASKMANVDTNILKASLIIEDLNGKVIAVIDEKGIKKNVNDNSLNEDAEKLLEKFDAYNGRIYENKQLGFKMYIIPDSKEFLSLFTLQTRIAYIASVIIVLLFVFQIVRKKQNIRLDLSVLLILLIAFDISNYYAFKKEYLDLSVLTIKMNILSGDIDAKEKQTYQYINLGYVGSKIYEDIDNNVTLTNLNVDFNEISNIILSQENESLYKRVFRYLNNNNQMFILMPNMKKIVLNDFTINDFNEEDRELYEESLKYSSIYYKTERVKNIKDIMLNSSDEEVEEAIAKNSDISILESDGNVFESTLKNIIRTYKIRLNNSYSLVMGIEYNGTEADVTHIENIIESGNISEGYVLVNRKDELQLGRIRKNKYEPISKFNDVSIISTTDKELIDKISEIDKIENLLISSKVVSHDGKMKMAVITKSFDTGLLQAYFADYEDVYYVKAKTMRNVLILVLLYILILMSDAALRNLETKKRDKREAIVLHNNY